MLKQHITGIHIGQSISTTRQSARIL